MDQRQPQRIKVQMINTMMKLCIFYIKTFTPIITHDELEPIMAKLGFIGLPHAMREITITPYNNDGGDDNEITTKSIAWKEYIFVGANGKRDYEMTPPKPGLPYPRIDGLHEYTFFAFLDAVHFYLGLTHISSLFQIRGVPLDFDDRHQKWRYRDKQDLLFIFREETLDDSTYKSYSNGDAMKSLNPLTAYLRSTPIRTIVPLKEIVVDHEANETS